MDHPNERILVVEDDRHLREQIFWSLRRDYDILQAGDRVEGLDTAQREKPDLILLDLHLPPDLGSEEGIVLVSEVRRAAPEAPVIVMTGDDSRDNALRAIEAGAYDYFRKPMDLDELRLIIRRALEKVRIERENRALKAKLQEDSSFEGILGVSKAMSQVFESIRRVAESNATVLILGESGTGKDMVARAVHNLSPRRDKPFIAVQCSAIPEHLIESELFGHDKGAFTGAIASRAGRFEMAHGGTLFLDEVGTMSPAIQTKLLRVLEQREFLRLGGKKPVRVDVRMVAATNEDLEARMRAGDFREDLYFRIHVFPIHMPALRERTGDIPLLINHFLKVYCEANSLTRKTITPDALELLAAAAWRGNVRELKNFVMTLILTTDADRITPADLPTGFGRRAGGDDSDPLLAAAGNGVTLPEAVGRFEVRMLHDALEKSEGVKVDAAKLLGIDKNRMMYLCRKHHI